MSTKPWIQKALDQGRKVPKWMRERDLTEEEFLNAMEQREEAFPDTKPKAADSTHRKFANFEVMETGGGCQALHRQTTYGFILITAAGDPSLPMVGEKFAIGFYDHDSNFIAVDDDGAHRIRFDCGDGVWVGPADTSDAEVDAFINAIGATLGH